MECIVTLTELWSTINLLTLASLQPTSTAIKCILDLTLIPVAFLLICAKCNRSSIGFFQIFVFSPGARIRSK